VILPSAQDVIELCYDAIAPNAKFIPSHAFAVAGYINGADTSFIWSKEDWALFPSACKFRINVTGDPSVGNFLDVERGDATVKDITPWINSRGDAGIKPLVVYVNRTNLPFALIARHNARHFAYMCVATLDGTMTYDNRAMVQFSNAALVGGPYDVSIIYNEKLRQEMVANLI
jgi:hypothetical protein